MGDENTLMDRQKAYKLAVGLCRTKIRMPTFEEYLKRPTIMDEFIDSQPNFKNFHPPMLFNHQKTLPIKEYLEEIREYRIWEKNQKENMAIFEEMLNEKGIRAGKAGVGEAHKGWGRSKRNG